jgi:hypothetical protein
MQWPQGTKIRVLGGIKEEVATMQEHDLPDKFDVPVAGDYQTMGTFDLQCTPRQQGSMH